MALTTVNSQEPDIQWGLPVASLRLGLYSEYTIFRLILQNVGTSTVKVLSHVISSGETHLDWFNLHMKDEYGNCHILRLLSDRNRSAEIQSQLKPNGKLQHSVDVAVWASREINQLQKFSSGIYNVSATYEVEDRANVWNGSIHSGHCLIFLDGN